MCTFEHAARVYTVVLVGYSVYTGVYRGVYRGGVHLGWVQDVSLLLFSVSDFSSCRALGFSLFLLFLRFLTFLLVLHRPFTLLTSLSRFSRF